MFEAIALACLAAHGDLVGKRIRDDIYRADKLLKALAKLNPEFYLEPCKVIEDGTGAPLVQYLKGKWLSKERLQKLYFEFDHEMQ